METNNRTKSLAIDCDGDGRIYSVSGIENLWVYDVRSIQFGLWSKNGIYSRRRCNRRIHRRTQCARLRLYMYVVQSQLFTSISNLTVWITVIGYSNQKDQSFLAFYTHAYTVVSAMCARCGLDDGIFDALRYTYLYETYWYCFSFGGVEWKVSTGAGERLRTGGEEARRVRRMCNVSYWLAWKREHMVRQHGIPIHIVNFRFNRAIDFASSHYHITSEMAEICDGTPTTVIVFHIINFNTIKPWFVYDSTTCQTIS